MKGIKLHAQVISKTSKRRRDFPHYSILLPVYKETAVIQKLIHSITKIEYPKTKLQVLIVVEETDIDLRRALHSMHSLPHFFYVIYVPDSFPKTKGKACNYALQYVKGEYVTIYDAEDVPCAQQLLYAVQKFEESDNLLACVQARLNFFNKDENTLTAIFSLEYYKQFNYLFPAFISLGFPIPIGGSSNHFRTQVLKDIGGWDAYNVTEDAELGYRLAKSGYRIEMMDSDTLEEAPINCRTWINQRTRWIKGHLVTYFKHIRDLKLYALLFRLRLIISLVYYLGILPFITLSITFSSLFLLLEFLEVIRFTNAQKEILNTLFIFVFFTSIIVNYLIFLIIAYKKQAKGFRK